MRRKYLLPCLLALVLMSFRISEQGGLSYPEYFPEPSYAFDRNPLSKEKVTLGRVLFYDPILSKDSSISCASCHSPYHAFAHTDHDLSHGIHDQIGTRNAPALFNLAWQQRFMWDGAINHLDMQALAPISHPQEMGETIGHVVEKLRRTSIYPELFFRAFGDSSITGERVLKSLSQFQLTLVSSTSKYDSVRLGKSEFSEQEQNGYLLFQQNCNTCHREPLFSTYRFANNGLPLDTTLNDLGRGGLTQNQLEVGKFKIPSLRNLSYSYPYMHDGRFDKLSQVINHYTNGIVIGETLSEELKLPISLHPNEKIDMVAFLLTLNDRSFVFNPKHQFPQGFQKSRRR
jgi:cytochrome c peroxidase